MSLPLPETRLPGLEPLLNGALWNEWADRGHVFTLEQLLPAIRYVRLKPSSSCRLVVFKSLDGTAKEPPEGILLHLYPDIARARLAFAKVSSHPLFPGSAGLEPFLDETHAVVGSPFPNDPDVPGLRHVYRPHRLRLALAEALSEYSPGSWKLRREARGMDLLRGGARSMPSRWKQETGRTAIARWSACTSSWRTPPLASAAGTICNTLTPHCPTAAIGAYPRREDSSRDSR